MGKGIGSAVKLPKRLWPKFWGAQPPRASDPKVDSPFGIDPMLRFRGGASFDTENWGHFSVSNDALAPGHAHVAADRRPAVAPVDDEIMSLRLAGDGVLDRPVQKRRVPFAQGRAEIGHVLLAEAHEELPGAGQPDPVAAFAEIMAQGRDEAEAAAGLPHPDVAGRASGAVVQVL